MVSWLGGFRLYFKSVVFTSHLLYLPSLALYYASYSFQKYVNSGGIYLDHMYVEYQPFYFPCLRFPQSIAVLYLFLGHEFFSIFFRSREDFQLGQVCSNLFRTRLTVSPQCDSVCVVHIFGNAIQFFEILSSFYPKRFCQWFLSNT